MAFIGRLHPLLIHFPIALVLAAAAAEAMAIVANERWHTVAVGQVRAAAVFAVVAAIAGWRMATASGMETSTVLEWHRWVGTMGAAATVAAALATTCGDGRSRVLSIYRVVLFAAAALVGAAGHLGGVLVWGADFLRF